jgi:hypothetical protein
VQDGDLYRFTCLSCGACTCLGFPIDNGCPSLGLENIGVIACDKLEGLSCSSLGYAIGMYL